MKTRSLSLFFVLLGFLAVVSAVAVSISNDRQHSVPAKVHSLPLKWNHVPQSHLDAHPHYRRSIKELSASSPAPPAGQILGGNILPTGIYWTTVSVGTPTQTFLVAVDSGSTDLVFPEVNCQGCHPNITGTYNPAASSSASLVPCSNGDYQCQCKTVNSQRACVFAASYETCNLTAPTQPCTIDCALYSDVIGLGTQSTQGVFGAIYSQTKNFQQLFYIDGIMGFIPDGSSSYGGKSAFETLAEAGLYTNMFAICLNASLGGQITLGGYDQSLMTGDFQYTSLLKTEPYYAVKFQNLLVGSTTIRTDQSTMIIDSGTNTLLVDTLNFNGVKNELISTLCPSFSGPGVCNNPSPSLFEGGCFSYSEAEIASFPIVSVVLDGATLEVTGDDYLVKLSDGTRCFGIANSGPKNLLIIGDVIMQKYYTLFDNVNRRLGWAPVNAEACAAGL